MMTLLGNHAIVCTEAIATAEMKQKVLESLKYGENHKYEVIEISLE